MKGVYLGVTLLLALRGFGQSSPEEIQKFSMDLKGGGNAIRLVSYKMELEAKSPKGEPIPVTIYVKDRRGFLMEFQTQGSTNFILVNELKGYKFMPYKGVKILKEMSAVEHFMFLTQSDIFGEFTDFRDKGYIIEPLGDEILNEKPFIHYAVVHAKIGVSKNIYLYKDNFQKYKESFSTEDEFGTLEFTNIFSDYTKTREGYLFPMKIENSLLGTMTVKSITVNPTMKETLFMNPPAQTKNSPK